MRVKKKSQKNANVAKIKNHQKKTQKKIACVRSPPLSARTFGTVAEDGRRGAELGLEVELDALEQRLVLRSAAERGRVARRATSPQKAARISCDRDTLQKFNPIWKEPAIQATGERRC